MSVDTSNRIWDEWPTIVIRARHPGMTHVVVPYDVDKIAARRENLEANGCLPRRLVDTSNDSVPRWSR